MLYPDPEDKNNKVNKWSFGSETPPPKETSCEIYKYGNVLRGLITNKIEKENCKKAMVVVDMETKKVYCIVLKPAEMMSTSSEPQLKKEQLDKKMKAKVLLIIDRDYIDSFKLDSNINPMTLEQINLLDKEAMYDDLLSRFSKSLAELVTNNGISLGELKIAL